MESFETDMRMSAVDGKYMNVFGVKERKTSHVQFAARSWDAEVNRGWSDQVPNG